MSTLYISLHRLVPHIFAASLAMVYAWWLSGTPLRTTGLQFVMPLLFILAVHAVLLRLQGQFEAGFSTLIYKRSFGTAVLIFATLIFGSVFAPKPAFAVMSLGDVVGTVGTIVVCALMIAFVIIVMMGIIRFIAWIFRSLFSSGSNSDDGPSTRFFDFGSLGVATVLIGTLSLEGVPGAYAFATRHAATSERVVDASPAQVWEALQTATSPDFPLPAFLDVFPRPVDVVVDEGIDLGANRVVRFEGREGSGALKLRVTERTDEAAVFTVLSDTSPIGRWIRYQKLTYAVVSDADGARLSVQFDFDRKLAPDWFFGPIMRAATYAAADVLARDVALRAELLRD